MIMTYTSTSFAKRKNKKKSENGWVLKIQNYKANSTVQAEVAHHEPPHLDMRCLQIKPFQFWRFEGKYGSPADKIHFSSCACLTTLPPQATKPYQAHYPNVCCVLRAHV